MADGNTLPAKVPVYLQRLHAEYEVDEPALAAVIGAARVAVMENTGYDNYNGGTNFHSVRLFLPARVLGKVKIRDQTDVAKRICSDLNACAAGIANEGIESVILELEDQNDPTFQQSRPYAAQPPINADALTVWRPGAIRLFISHRDANKGEAHALADALEQYGVSAFVAHDTIEPMTTWKDEILIGLRTMEVMLALVTDDFDASIWSQQEVGFALGRDVPIIPLKVGRKDPPGFISSIQALKGRLDDLAASAGDVYSVLAEKLGNRSRLQGALISAFTGATNFEDAIARFDRMSEVVTRISEDELIQIKAAFTANDQLHNCIYLTNRNERLKRFLERVTGQRIIRTGIVINTPSDKVPF